MKARLLSLMVACLLPLVGMSQDDSKNTIDIPTDSTDAHITPPLRDANTSLLPRISPSPQAEAFQKVGDYTVNNSSGMPDISIPLYEIDHCGYKIPLTLRYIATPLRPSYNYDVTGHGWTLSSGYCITRSIEYIPDESNNFQLHPTSSIMGNVSGYNLRYDQFHATLPDGSSFYFYMHKENNQLEYVISDRKEWKIICNANSYNIESFIVTDNTGIKYYFTKADYAIGVQNSHNVTWYLTKIELTNSTTPILFQYDQYIKQTTVASAAEPVSIFERKYNYPVTLPVSQRSFFLTETTEFPNTNTNYKMPLLSSISYGPTVISFTYQYPDNEREFNYLDKIVVLDNQTTVKEFHFSYNISRYITYDIANLSRLVEKGALTETDSLVYSFTYSGFADNMRATDHWGYSTDGNNINNVGYFNVYMERIDLNPNEGDFPYTTFLSDNPLSIYGLIKLKLYGNLLNSDPRQGSDASKHNYLTSITYPTGGKTSFVFEPHRFVTATNTQGDYTAVKRNRQVIQGGGFRIKKIYNYTADGQLADARTFCYGPTYRDANNHHLNLPVPSTNMSLNHIGFGEPVVDPNILTYTNFKSSYNIPQPINEMLLGMLSSNGNGNHYSPFEAYATIWDDWHWQCSFSPLFFRSLLMGRNAVVYPEITEYYGDVTNLDMSSLPITGKTVYKYNIYNEMEDSVYAERIVYYGHVLNCNEDLARREWLTEKATYSYDGTFHLQQKENYDYQFYEQPYVYDYIFGNNYTPGDGPNSYNNNSPDGALYQKVNILTNKLLTQKTDTLYTTTDPYTNIESYVYNDKDLLTGKSTMANWSKTTSYAYPSASANAPEIERWLRSRNMMATVLQQKTRLAPNDIPMDVSGYKMDYAPFDFGDTLLLPKYLYRLNANYSGSSFEEVEQVKSYSANGNPLEVVDQSGMHTVYLWGYNDRYLIAEIKNATDSIVSAAVSSIFGMSITNLANANAPNTTHLKSLHTYAALGNAMITTWTYKPLVGVTSQTNPSGMTTYYDYDGLGRLKEVYRYKDNIVSASNKQILNQYNYHTQAQ
jgi:YD repeat-containing protein